MSEPTDSLEERPTMPPAAREAGAQEFESLIHTYGEHDVRLALVRSRRRQEEQSS